MKIGDLFIKLGLQKGEFDKGIDDAKRKSSAFGDGMKKIGGMIAGVFAVGAIVSFFRESQKLAAETENVRKAFVRLGGGQYFNDLNNAARGTLSQVDLMKNTIQATNFGIPIKDLANLFKFATEKASQTGQSVEYLTQSIVMGIGRKSVLILDNLGISAVQLREQLKKTGEEAATVGDVAAAIGRIAEESFKKMGEQATTTSQKLDDVKGSWTDIKIAIGDAINQNDLFIGSIKVVNDYLNVFSAQVANAMTNAGGRVKKFMSGLPEDISSQKAAIKTEIERINKEISGLEEKQSLWDYATLGGKMKHDDRKQEINTLKNQAIELAGIFDTLKVKEKPVELKQRISDLELLISMEKKLASVKNISAEEAVTHANAIKKAEEELKALREIAGIKEPKTAAQKLADSKAINATIEEEIVKSQDAINKSYYDAGEGAFEAFMKGIENSQIKIDAPTLEYEKEKEDDLSYISDLYQNQLDEARNFTDELNSIIQGGISSAIETLASGLTELAMGDMTGKEFGAQILGMVGNFMVQMGMAFITFSKLFIAFHAAISGMNGPLALGIGIALVGAGAVISTIAKKGMSGGASASAPASGYSNYSQSNGISAITGNVIFELEGTKLRGALNNTDRKNTLIR